MDDSMGQNPYERIGRGEVVDADRGPRAPTAFFRDDDDGCA